MIRREWPLQLELEDELFRTAHAHRTGHGETNGHGRLTRTQKGYRYAQVPCVSLALR